MTIGRRTVALVSCVSAKQSRAAPAGELYTSALFTKARAYARRYASAWFVLSAKHGVLDPSTVIEPYDKTLNNMSVAERRDWAAMVTRQLDSVLRPGDTALFLAGARYREGLEPALRAKGVRVEVPMLGMRIGEQLSWLTRQGSR
jgi:hypothetical protein